MTISQQEKRMGRPRVAVLSETTSIRLKPSIKLSMQSQALEFGFKTARGNPKITEYLIHLHDAELLRKLDIS